MEASSMMTRLASLVAAATLMSILLFNLGPEPAQATPQPGLTIQGLVSGGGTIFLMTAQDGSGLLSFGTTNVTWVHPTGFICSATQTTTLTPPFELTDDHIDYSRPGISSMFELHGATPPRPPLRGHSRLVIAPVMA
jgi:hypothetical protein